MKKITVSVLLLSFLFIIIPGTSLFADTGLEGRTDLGANLFVILPLMSEFSDGEFSILPVFPLIDAGFYGQFTIESFHLGIGMRGLSLIYINLFWPSVFAELDLGRFTLNARIGGGIFYLFPIYMVAIPYFIPELSLWYTFGKKIRFQAGFGAVTLLSSQGFSGERFYDIMSDFQNNALIYLGIRAVFTSSRLKKTDEK